MRGTARLGDRTTGTCSVHPGTIGGTIITSSDDVKGNSRGVARLGDTVLADCGHTALIITAAGFTKANSRGFARLSDLVQGPEYKGSITSCSGDVSGDDQVSVGGVNLPPDQNSQANAQTVINELGMSAIADSYETNSGATTYPPGAQTSPPGPITDASIVENNTVPDDKATPVTDCTMITTPVDYTFQLSTHFRLDQLSTKCIFPHAIKAQNGLSLSEIVCNLKALSEHVLEPIWAAHPNFRVNSAFRTKQNGKSQHEKGQAADLQWPGMSYDQLWVIVQWIKDNINYDQLLWEHGKSPWIHVSFNTKGNRSKSDANKVMTMYNDRFSPGLKKMA